MIELNYGKYSIPRLLNQVIQLQKELNNEGLLDYGDLLGYYFSLDDLESRYLNTPLDVISFARPGSDGIHYGFLTDFGQASELDTAYIVRVSPMDFDDPVKIVARNLQDFLRIICYFPNAIDLVDITTNKDLFEKWLKEFPEVSINEIDNAEQDRVRGLFHTTFQLEPIKSLFEYFKEVKLQRDNEIAVATEDSIGVVSNRLNEENQMNMTLFNFNEVDSLETTSVKHFFENYSYEAKLAFFRDAQSKGLIYDNQELKAYLKQQLLLLHLNDEAARISYPE